MAPLHLNFSRPPTHATRARATWQSAEAFLSRCVWDSARVTSRHSRKTLMLRDFMSALHEHPNPEAVQVFLDEFQVPREPKESKRGRPKGSGAAASKKAKA